MVTTIASYYKIDRRSGYEAIVIRFVKVLSIQVLLTFTYIVVAKGTPCHENCWSGPTAVFLSST